MSLEELAVLIDDISHNFMILLSHPPLRSHRQKRKPISHKISSSRVPKTTHDRFHEQLPISPESPPPTQNSHSTRTTRVSSLRTPTIFSHFLASPTRKSNKFVNLNYKRTIAHFPAPSRAFNPTYIE